MIDDAPVAQVLQAPAEMNHKTSSSRRTSAARSPASAEGSLGAEALRAVADSAGLSCNSRGRSSTRTLRPRQKANQAQREAEQEKRLQNLPLQAESVTLHFADAEELAKSGGKLLSAGGTPDGGQAD